MIAVYVVLLALLTAALVPLATAARIRRWLLHYPRSPGCDPLPGKPGEYLRVEWPPTSEAPLAVLLPGAGSRSRSSMAAAARFYESHGIRIAWVDWLDRNHRDGPLGWGLPEARQLAGALAAVRGPVLIHGRSFGAAVAVIAQGLSPRDWTVVAESCYASLAEVLERRLLRYRLLTVPLHPLLHLGLARANRQLKSRGIDIATGSPERYLRAKRGAVLFLHGTADRLVPAQHSRRLFEKARWLGLETRLVLIPRGRHSHLREVDVSTWEEALGWAVARVCGKSS